MEKLLLLQSKVTKNKDFIVNSNDLVKAGLSPCLLYPPVNPLGEW
jgi:hypothetical protein